MKPSPQPPRRIIPWKMFVSAMIPNWLLCRREVSSGAKLAYARLCQFSGRDGLCFPKQATLAAELGVSERAVRNYLRELEGLHLVEVDQLGLGRTNRYAFLAHPWMTDAPGAEPDTAERQGCSGPDRQDSADPERQVSSGPIGEENQDEENQSHTHGSAPSLSPSPSLQEVLQAAEMRAIPRDCAEKFFHEQESVGWVNRRGLPLRKWPAALQGYAVSWRAVDHQRAASPPRASRPRSRNGAFANLPQPGAFTSTEI